MREMDLGFHRKARIWIDDLPLLGPSGTPRPVLTLSACPNPILPRAGAVEFYAPLGARFQYGFLGGQVSPSEPDQFCVEVALPTESDQRWEASLLNPSLDVAKFGLPQEYVDAVKEGILLVEKELVVAGRLVVSQSAYSNIGSSQSIFKLLAIVLTRILLGPSIHLIEEEISKMFKDAYTLLK